MFKFVIYDKDRSRLKVNKNNISISTEFSGSNYKYVNSLSKEANELLRRGIFKDVNAATVYIWFKLKHSFINSELPKIQIDTDPINNTLEVSLNDNARSAY